ncbi:hypothetical protein Thiowin_04318 [Thiorhodovibrio winogradskyi]|uniref:Uncharacterized protein n=1 Tax=Thiorhodovibrio winogradskyi TaxID=77007 RepID=A0ABZ0SDV7_9GAMM|nr:hypothetical protein [Thiorhodovibrio winogradskyi]
MGHDEQALREAGVGNHDVAVVAIGEELEANILCWRPGPSSGDAHSITSSGAAWAPRKS